MATKKKLKSVLYMGDTSLGSNAGYLAGIMTAFGIAYDYIPSDKPLELSDLGSHRRLFILSDYPAAMISHEMQNQIVTQVREEGAGLLMIGGWESFQGSGGDWHNSPIAQALPVDVDSEDDRVNHGQVALISRVLSHPIVDSLPWDTHPPCIAGYNRLEPTAGGEVILQTTRLAPRCVADGFQFDVQETAPMLLVRRFVKGRTAALATDVAPHWVGSFVDWGPQRIAIAAPGGLELQVGSWYADFFRNLLVWTGRLDKEK